LFDYLETQFLTETGLPGSFCMGNILQPASYVLNLLVF